MNKKEVQEVSFQLISFAGDAYSLFQQAVANARMGKFEEAEEQMKEGREQLTKAHGTQTELLSAEAQGKDLEYSVILVHAQDHLMNAIMFEQIAKEFIVLYRERK